MNAPPVGVRPDAFSANMLIDATGEKAAAIGSVWTPNRGSKNITRIQFPFGAVTKAGGSALTLSLQDVDTANAFRPDGGADQTVAIANADAAFLSNTWYRSGALSATRTVAFGDLVAVVLEYDGGGRLGADSVVWSQLLRSGEVLSRGAGNALFTSSWAIGQHPVIVLEFDDGTFGTLDGASIAKTLSTLAYKSDSSPDEHALVINPVAPMKVDGFWVSALCASTAADFDIVLYDGTTPLVTKSFDAHTLFSIARAFLIESFAEQTLAVGSTYYLALKPSQATATATLHYFDINHADHRQAMPGGTQFSYANRVDGGAWANQSTTRIPYMGLRISAVSDGAGGSGGMLVHPGMSGGCNG